MPLARGKSRETIAANIREMSKTHPHDQAVAAALHNAYDRATGGRAAKKSNRSIIEAALRLAVGGKIRRKHFDAGGGDSGDAGGDAGAAGAAAGAAGGAGGDQGSDTGSDTGFGDAATSAADAAAAAANAANADAAAAAAAADEAAPSPTDVAVGLAQAVDPAAVAAAVQANPPGPPTDSPEFEPDVPAVDLQSTNPDARGLGIMGPAFGPNEARGLGPLGMAVSLGLADPETSDNRGTAQSSSLQAAPAPDPNVDLEAANFAANLGLETNPQNMEPSPINAPSIAQDINVDEADLAQEAHEARTALAVPAPQTNDEEGPGRLGGPRGPTISDLAAALAAQRAETEQNATLQAQALDPQAVAQAQAQNPPGPPASIASAIANAIADPDLAVAVAADVLGGLGFPASGPRSETEAPAAFTPDEAQAQDVQSHSDVAPARGGSRISNQYRQTQSRLRRRHSLPMRHRRKTYRLAGSPLLKISA
jgi:hypothetical protein